MTRSSTVASDFLAGRLSFRPDGSASLLPSNLTVFWSVLALPWAHDLCSGLASNLQISLFKYPTRGLESVSISKAIKCYARFSALRFSFLW